MGKLRQVQYSFRLNLDNPKHLEIHHEIMNADKDIYKSMSGFIVECLSKAVAARKGTGPSLADAWRNDADLPGNTESDAARQRNATAEAAGTAAKEREDGITDENRDRIKKEIKDEVTKEVLEEVVRLLLSSMAYRPVVEREFSQEPQAAGSKSNRGRKKSPFLYGGEDSDDADEEDSTDEGAFDDIDPALLEMADIYGG